MQGTATLLTPNEMAYTLGIDHSTLAMMVHNCAIPHTYIQSTGSCNQVLCFNPYGITEWLQTKPQMKTGRKEYLDKLREMFLARFPETMKTFKDFDTHFAPKRAPRLQSY